MQYCRYFHFPVKINWYCERNHKLEISQLKIFLRSFKAWIIICEKIYVFYKISYIPVFLHIMTEYRSLYNIFIRWFICNFIRRCMSIELSIITIWWKTSCFVSFRLFREKSLLSSYLSDTSFVAALFSLVSWNTYISN